MKAIVSNLVNGRWLEWVTPTVNLSSKTAIQGPVCVAPKSLRNSECRTSKFSLSMACVGQPLSGNPTRILFCRFADRPC